MVCELNCTGMKGGGLPTEQRAISALVQCLNDSEVAAALMCFAEGAPCSWTMDAVLKIEGEIWIIDHTRLTWPAPTMPWMQEADSVLRMGLDHIANELGIRIMVMVPDLRGIDDKRTRKGIFLRFLDELGTACSTKKQAESIPTEFTKTTTGFSFQLLPATGKIGQSSSMNGIAFSMAQGRDLKSQLTEFNLPTVLGKLSRQLAPALGYFDHVGLLLDQRYIGGENPPLTNSILTADSICSVLDSEFAIQRSSMDRVWLIGEGDVVQEVWKRTS